MGETGLILLVAAVWILVADEFPFDVHSMPLWRHLLPLPLMAFSALFAVWGAPDGPA